MVDTEHDLTAGRHPVFDDGRRVRPCAAVTEGDTSGGRQVLDTLAVAVWADNAHQHGLMSQGDDVACNVARSAQGFCDRVDVDDRSRSLQGDA